MKEEKCWKMQDWIRMSLIFRRGEDNKAKIYFTLTGTKYYHGNEFLKPGMKLKLKKKQDNKFDKEANSMQYWS